MLTNLISFNIGVELGQLFALGFMLLAFSVWRSYSSFEKHAFLANTIIMTGGFLAIAYQLTSWYLQSA